MNAKENPRETVLSGRDARHVVAAMKKDFPELKFTTRRTKDGLAMKATGPSRFLPHDYDRVLGYWLESFGVGIVGETHYPMVRSNPKLKLVNLTPHPIVLQTPEGDRYRVEPSGTVARVASIPGDLVDVPGIPVPVAGPDRPGQVTGVPRRRMDTVLIVSGFVGAALKGQRDDILVPGTGPADGAIRNERGHIVAVTRLKIP